MLPKRTHHTERRCKGRHQQILQLLADPSYSQYLLTNYLWRNMWVVRGAYDLERMAPYYRTLRKNYKSPHEVQLCKERFAVLMRNPSIEMKHWRWFLHLDVAAGLRNPAMSMWLLESPQLLSEGEHMLEIANAVEALGLPEYFFVRDLLRAGVAEEEQARRDRRTVRRLSL